MTSSRSPRATKAAAAILADEAAAIEVPWKDGGVLRLRPMPWKAFKLLQAGDIVAAAALMFVSPADLARFEDLADVADFATIAQAAAGGLSLGESLASAGSSSTTRTS